MHVAPIEFYKNNPIPTAATNTLPPTHFSIFPAIPVKTDSVAVAVLLPVNVALLPPLVFVALSEATGGVVGVVYAGRLTISLVVVTLADVVGMVEALADATDEGVTDWRTPVRE